MEELGKKLIELSKQHNASGIKVELESEYFSHDELNTLRCLAYKADIDFAIKLGGFSSFRDMYEAKELNADIIIAPMIETPYALEKFINTLKKVFPSGQNKPKLFINIETKTALENIDEIFNSEYMKNTEGIVFGRGDFIKSFDISDVEDDKVLKISEILREKTNKYNKKLTIGGEITLKSIDFLDNIIPDFTETKKVIFEGIPSKEGIIKGIEFEKALILKKKNKSQNDYLRLEKLKERIKA